MRGARRKARELAIQALYQSELGGEGVRAAVEQLAAGVDPAQVDLEYFRKVVLGAGGRTAELDGWIDRVVEHWTLERLAVIDRCILRLGIHELLAEADLPVGVIINEAVDLAKRYGGEGSQRFINGILDRVAEAVRPRETGTRGRVRPAGLQDRK